jgi:hypothetical protein
VEDDDHLQNRADVTESELNGRRLHRPNENKLSDR